MKTTISMNGGWTEERELLTVSIWKGHINTTKPVTKETLTEYLENSDMRAKNVLTQSGNLYSTFDTPGYCDGEITISREKLTNLASC